MKKTSFIFGAILVFVSLFGGVASAAVLPLAPRTTSTFNNLLAPSNASTTPATSTDTTTIISLQRGDQSVIVSVLQKLLMKGGYCATPITPTGYYGALTQAAVIAYQKKHGLAETGIFTIAADSLPQFFAMASTTFSETSIGSSGQQATSLQKFLIAAGYLKIAKATGYFGSLTQAALKAFQAAHGLSETGVVDQATFAAMNGSSVSGASTQ